MRVKLLSDIEHDGQKLLEDAIVDVKDEIAEAWVRIGAAVEAFEEAGNNQEEVVSPQPPLTQAPSTPAAPTQPQQPVQPEVQTTPAAQAPNPVNGQPTAADVAATLAATGHSETQPEVPPAA